MAMSPRGQGRRRTEDFVEGADPVPIRSVLSDENALLSINYTSGTTGRTPRA